MRGCGLQALHGRGPDRRVSPHEVIRMSDRQEIRRLLGRLSLCSDLTPEALEALELASSLRCLAAGETLAMRGESLNHVYGLCDGFVRSEVISESGDRFLVDVHGPGDSVCLAAFLQGSPTPVDLRAQGPARVLLIRGSILEHALDTFPRLSRNAAQLLASGYELVREQLQAQGFLDAEAALAFRVSRFVGRHGLPHPGGGHVLPFRLSQEDLGAAIGFTREAIGRILRRWEQLAWVDLGYARIVVRDLEALEARYLHPSARVMVPALTSYASTARAS